MPEHVPADGGHGVVRVVYAKLGTSPGLYGVLQDMSSSREPNPADMKIYLFKLPNLAKRLADSVGRNFDAIVTPPSSHNRSHEYKKALAPNAPLDLSSRFSKDDGVHSGTGLSYDEYFAGTHYKSGKDEAAILSLLIVDEIVGSGRTAKAIVEHLRRAGMPRECEVTLAAPLWVKNTPSILD